MQNKSQWGIGYTRGKDFIIAATYPTRGDAQSETDKANEAEGRNIFQMCGILVEVDERVISPLKRSQDE